MSTPETEIKEPWDSEARENKISGPICSFKGKCTEKLEKLDDLPKIIQLVRHKDWTRTQTS